MQDILWWQNFISTFNGKSLILDKYPVTSVYTDACPEGGGGHFGSDWFYAKWDAYFAFTKDLHINELEALSVVLAAIRWGKTWQNKKVIVYSDNMATVGRLTPLTYSKFLSRLKQSLSHIGINPDKYSGHSFRRGGASFALECGIPTELIQSQGDWKSDAYKRYIDPSLDHRHVVMDTFAKRIQGKL
ncbi:unnamed protein product [Mytilus coruscus]|uniref:Tyr recombinase domain-containing protein n=1 Tax=Mytilus coruscus TaxID=42192 RepID=A0A6J7ZWD5_MYTCO|nr:unnamed protein product [Mytilus coruscus]